MQKCKPNIVIYNAGIDILKCDPLSAEVMYNHVTIGMVWWLTESQCDIIVYVIQLWDDVRLGVVPLDMLL